MRFYRLSVSVRKLVEFVYLKGDLNFSFSSQNRMQEGNEGHKYLQSNREENWQNEVSLKYEKVTDNSAILIKGRIDGVYQDKNTCIIEEIKTYIGRENFKEYKFSDFAEEFSEFSNIRLYGKSLLHWAQVLIYSYLFAQNNKLDKVSARLKYLKSSDNEEISFEVTFVRDLKEDDFGVYSFSVLESFFEYTFNQWFVHHLQFSEWTENSQESLINLQFPYEFRAEQRKMAVAVYRVIRDSKNLFSRAPTGTGKTLASLFPALKTMGEKHTEKIFYLTAKTIGRTVAEKTIQLLQKNGAMIRYCVLTAKEKACLKEFTLCEPDYCEYTIDFYEKLKQALDYAFTLKVWNYNTIDELARMYMLCPFELSLCLAEYAEVVICDYNYCFDPVIILKRFFEDGLSHNYCFLVDEAHNLTDRAREMYSGILSKVVIRQWLENFPKKRIICRELNALCDELSLIAPSEKDFVVLDKFPENISKRIISIQLYIEKQLDKKLKAFLKYMYLKVYFQLQFFMNVLGIFSENHVIYFQRDKEDCILKIFCVNPREIFADYLKNAKSTVFFSATLHPFSYFCDILASKESDVKVSLLSPFESRKFALYLYTGINTMYQYRENSYQPLADLIYNAVCQKKGNYIIYFPSFSFMEKVVECISKYNLSNLVCQNRTMKENERERFLDLFEDKDSPVIAFAVLGGIFGEGIDLTGDRLIGCMIVSVGLPLLGGEKTFIKDYYDKTNHQGFDYAYRFPGFNKVMQAAGRVIRTEEDKGWVILVDTRYTRNEYKELFPPEWLHYKIYNNMQIIKDIKNFWEN